MDYSNADEIACSKQKLSDLLDKISHLLHKMEKKKKGRKSRVTKKPYSNFSLSVQFSNFTLASYHINDSTNTVRKKIKIACFHYKDGKLKHCVYHGI